MRTRLRIWLAGVAALAAAAPAVVLSAAVPAGASPVGYTLLVTVVEVTMDGGIPTCQLNQIDLATGALTPLPTSDPDACVDDLTMAPDGRVFGIQLQCGGELCLDTGAASFAGEQAVQQIDEEVHLIQFDLTTGAPTDLGAITGGPATTFIESPISFGGLTFDKDGNLFVEMVGESFPCFGNAFCLYRVNPANPADATFVGFGTPFTEFQVLAAQCGTAPEAVTLRPFEAGVDSTDVEPEALPVSNQTLLERNLSNGATSPIGPTGADAAITGMAFDSNGALWAVGIDGGTMSVFTISTTTGAATASSEIDAGESLVVGLALPLDCPEELVVAFTG